MILLDTDHLTILHYLERPRCRALSDRLKGSGQEIFITVITVEEEMRGWLAKIRKCKEIDEQIPAYAQLAGMIEFFQDWYITPLNEPAAAEFVQLKKIKVRIGTRDLKIAAIALANDALLLSANLSDFRQVPGLRVENWLS